MVDKKKVIDEFDNIFKMTEEISSGGQGIVYRTTDPDLAIKIPLKDNLPIRNEKDINAFNNKIEKISLLQLPKNIPITLPKSLLKKEIIGNDKNEERNIAGYVMKLLDNMESLGSTFRVNNVSNIEEYYPKSGSTKYRFYILFKLACILARLHNIGVVYCDLSYNNIFISKKINEDENKNENENGNENNTFNKVLKPKICLIDSDNLILERLKSGADVLGTKFLIAPEIYREYIHRPLTDIWSFAIIAFQLLFCINPFDGKLFYTNNESDDDWANENTDDEENINLSLDEKKELGLLPFIFDSNDTSNSVEKIPVPYDVLTPKLKVFFQETLGIGRTKPYRRTNMSFWALEFAHANDESIVCTNPKCNMSYFPEEHQSCPFCKEKHPLYINVKNEQTNWNYFIQPKKCYQCGEYYFEEIYDKCPNCDNKPNIKKMNVISIPHRLFKPFSFQYCDDDYYKIEIDLKNKKIINIYNEFGNICCLPEEISIKFNGGF